MTSTTGPAGASPEELGEAPDTTSATTPAQPDDGTDQGDPDTDRPGDIPFEQAAAEHENPALE